MTRKEVLDRLRNDCAYLLDFIPTILDLPLRVVAHFHDIR